MWYTCQFCGKQFEIIGEVIKRPVSKIVCSEDCAKALSAQSAYDAQAQAKYRREHRDEINGKRRDARSKMSPDEHKNHRDTMNRYKREWIAAMSPGELKDYRAKANAYAKRYYEDHKPKTERHCIVCGKLIPPGTRYRKFCSDACMAQNRVDRNHRYYEMRKDRKKGGQNHEENH